MADDLNNKSGTRGASNQKTYRKTPTKRIEDLESLAIDLEKVQSSLAEEQSWQRNFLYLGWIVIVVTLVATVISLFNLIIDFYSYKGVESVDTVSEEQNDSVVINIYQTFATTTQESAEHFNFAN